MIPSRLDKFLSDSTALSRSQIRTAFEAGEIEVQLASGEYVDPVELSLVVYEEDKVWCQGELVRPKTPEHYILLHKPSGVLSSATEEEGVQTLSPWVGPHPGVFPVGRLDQSTSGFMLITDDGNLAHMIMSPKQSSIYEFILVLRGQIYPEDRRLEQMLRGLRVKRDLTVSVISLEVTGGTNRYTHLRVSVDEGRSRHLRGLCHVAGVDVVRMHRTRIGPVAVGTLRPGETRELTQEEIESLWQMCGGKDLVFKRRIGALYRLIERYEEVEKDTTRLRAWLEEHAEKFVDPDELASLA